ncbi:MAG: hypothetical protein ACP5IA_01810 [Sediminispirochaetaceae bacterium]
MQRLKTMCSLTFLLTFAATVGWTGPADPWGIPGVNPVDEYSAYVRDQSLLYSQRLYECENGVNERLRLADEYHRNLEQRLHLLMEEWESTARDELLSRRIDPYQGDGAAGIRTETADMEADLASRKQRYLRECEQVGELFSRHYVLPELDRRSGEGGSSEAPFTMVEAELQILSSADKDFQGLSAWRSAEDALVSERLDWERMAEQQYSAERRKIDDQYAELLQLEERWESGFLRNLEESREQWDEGFEKFVQERHAAEEQLMSASQRENILFREDLEKLLQLTDRARGMKEEAEGRLFIGNDGEYWGNIRDNNAVIIQESLEVYAEIAPFGSGADGAVFELLTDLSGARLEHAEREREYLEELVYSDGGSGVSFMESLGTLLDSSEMEELRNLLEDELKASVVCCGDLSAEHTRLMARIESAREAMEGSGRIAEFQVSIGREQAYRGLQRQIQTAAGTLAALEAELAVRREEIADEQRRQTAQILPAGAENVPEFLAAMKSGNRQEDPAAVLRDLALSFYHEHAEEIDPGYISRNQVYRKLKDKIGYAEEGNLAAAAESARQRISGLPDEKELYDLYTEILLSGALENTLLYRAMVEDTGKILFDGILDSSGEKIESLKTERGILYGQAAYYGGLATLCYATLNFGGGAALTAIAAGFLTAAGEVGKEIGDIRSLRESLQEQPMSGREEREEFLAGIDELDRLDKRLAEVEQHEEYLQTQEYTPEEWLDELCSSESLLCGLVDSEFLATAEGLQISVPETGGNKIGVFEFFDRLDSEAENLRTVLELRNDELIRESADTLREFRMAVLEGNLQMSITESADAAGAAEILRTAAQDLDVLACNRVVELRTLEEEGRLAEFMCRMDGEAAGRLHFRGQQEHIAALCFHSGQEKWEAERALLEGEAVRWEEAFRHEYQGNRTLWDARIRQFEEGRRVWIEEAAREKADRIVTDGVSMLGIDPGCWQEQLSAVPLDRLPAFHFPAGIREGIPAGFPAPLQQGNPAAADLLVYTENRSAGYHNRIDRLYQQAEKMIQETAFRTGLERLSGIIEGHQRDLTDAVESANDDVRVSLHTVLEGAGYRRDGRTFERNSLIDVTLFSRERELHAIGAYRDYELPEMNWAGKLRGCAEDAQGYEDAQGMYRRYLEEIGVQRRLILGGYTGMEESVLEKVSEAARELFLTERQDFHSSGQYEKYRDTEGLFAWHVGYAPEMDPDNPGRVERAGSGEVGRIMTSYYRNEFRLSRGLSLLDTAVWDRKVWDDDHDNDGEADGFFRAPTARRLADLGLQAAAGLFIGPGITSVLAGLADDAFFQGADAVGGYSSAGDALFGFGKTAVLQSALAGNNMLWKAGGRPAGWIDGDGLFDGVLPALGKTAGERILTSTAAAVSFGAGEFHWDADLFLDSLGSRESGFAYASAAAGTLAGNMVHNSLYDRENTYGFSQYDLQQMEMAAGTGGRLAGAGLEYLCTGSTALNLTGAGGTGLLELRLDSDGVFLAAGSGGHRFTLSDAAVLRNGAGNYLMQRRINQYAERNFSSPELQTLAAQVLRFQASFGDRDARKVVTDILRGADELRFLEAADYRGRTTAGEDGSRTISLNLYPRSGLDPASHALTLQHEAHRDGVVQFFSEMNNAETALAVRAHTDMGGRIILDRMYGGSVFSSDPQIFLDMAMLADNRTGTAGIQSVYSSEEDYWKLTGSGAVLWDGSHHLWTEGGKLMVPHQSGSFSRDIADYLGISQKEARVLMERAGLIWDSGLGTYRQEESDYTLTAPSGLYAQYELLNRFGELEEGDVPVTGNQAYAWAVREHALRAGSGSYGDREYEQGMEAGLSSRENFLETAGLKGRTEFPGITGRADLNTYSQQWLEMSTAGRALDGSRGEGYCLAESIACRYVDRYEEVDWEAVRSAFAGTDWGPAFDPTTGMVGDKQLFTAKLAATFDVDSTATEYRFDALSGAQNFIRQEAGTADGVAEYSVVADYGGHFTHVRPDGLEINTYPGWSSVGREPREWRVYLWD